MEITLVNQSLHLRSRCRQTGFTLIETAMTTVIIGVAFVAMLQLIAAGTVSNARGASITTGMNLAKNVREMSLKLEYDQIATMNGTIYSPPVDSRGEGITGFDDWTQTVQVQAVDPDYLTINVNDPDPDCLKLTVNVTRGGQTVCSVSWLCFGAR